MDFRCDSSTWISQKAPTQRQPIHPPKQGNSFARENMIPLVLIFAYISWWWKKTHKTQKKHLRKPKHLQVKRGCFKKNSPKQCQRGERNPCISIIQAAIHQTKPETLPFQITPQKTNMSPKKGLFDYFSRKYIWTNHWFSGDIRSFSGE